jgi:curved DNA-binding protein CbpA
MSDPYQVLGIARGADDAAVRAAYLAAVRRHPPERDAERFAAVRRAFDAVSTVRLRLEYELFNQEAPTLEGLLHLLQADASARRPDTASLLRVLKGGADGR